MVWRLFLNLLEVSLFCLNGEPQELSTVIFGVANTSSPDDMGRTAAMLVLPLGGLGGIYMDVWTGRTVATVVGEALVKSADLDRLIRSDPISGSESWRLVPNADTGLIPVDLDGPAELKGRGLTRSDIRRTRSFDMTSTTGAGLCPDGNNRSEADFLLSSADTYKMLINVKLSA